VRHVRESLTGLITAPASYLGLHFDFDFDVSKTALSLIKPRTCASGSLSGPVFRARGTPVFVAKSRLSQPQGLDWLASSPTRHDTDGR
jgi:hypothetical protein